MNMKVPLVHLHGLLGMESCVERREMLRELRIAPLGKLAQATMNGVLELPRQANLTCVKQNATVTRKMDQEQETMESGVD